MDWRGFLLNSFGFPVPLTGLSAIFRHQDSKQDPVITHGTLLTGKFGVVCAGVIALTGEPMPVKQHRADGLHELRLILGEAEVGMQFEVYNLTVRITIVDLPIALSRIIAHSVFMVRTPIYRRVRSIT